MLPNKDIAREARKALKGHWGLAAGASALRYAFNLPYVLFILLAMVPAREIPRFETKTWIMICLYFVVLAFYGVFGYGFARLWLGLARKDSVNIRSIFQGFSHFVKFLITGVLLAIRIQLWTLLLFVPGLIASYSYSMTFFLMNDDPTLSPREAIAKSKHLMYGHRLNLLSLQLHFCGWFLLSLPMGIGYLWFIPYVNVSMAKFYDLIKLQR